MTGKFKIVVSDLHLGIDTIKNQTPLGGFRADVEFANLLNDVRRESEEYHQEVEFILNGDSFAFLQVPAVDLYDPDRDYRPAAYLDSSAEASIKRLNIIAESHPQVFTALRDFVNSTTPIRRVTIIKGNHDVHLYWPEVKNRLRHLLNATDDRSSRLLFAESFINREGLYIEHGHQRAEQMNVYPNFNLPLDGRDRSQLYYPPGSRFLINRLLPLKADAWWIDQIQPATAAIWYALKLDFDLAARLVAEFMRELPEARANNVNPNISRSLDYLLDQLENDEDCDLLAQNYLASSEGRKMLHQQIQVLTHNARVSSEFYPPLVTAISYDPLEMAKLEQDAIQMALKQCAQKLARHGKAKVFIFGHSHQPAFEQLREGITYLNTGAWLWTQYDDDLAALNGHALTTADQQAKLSIPRLPYAYIAYDQTEYPQPMLYDYSGRGFSWQRQENMLLKKIKGWFQQATGVR